MEAGYYNSKADKLQTGTRHDPDEGYGIPDESEISPDLIENDRVRRKSIRQARFMQQLQRKEDGQDAEIRARMPKGVRFAEDQQSVRKFDGTDVALLYVLAAIFDLLSAGIGLIDLVLPGIGSMIGAITIIPLGGSIFFFIYQRHGISFRDTKYMIRFFFPLITNLIPVVSILPDFILNVTLIVAATKAEEKLGVRFRK